MLIQDAVSLHLSCSDTKAWLVMKTSTFLTSALCLAVVSLSLTAIAEDPRYPATDYGSNYRSAPNRSLLGLPMPQQWSGVRPAGMNRGSNGQAYAPAGFSTSCPNGQFQTGSCPNGQCSTGAFANGQCLTGACANGQCSTGQCPNGNCGTAPYTNLQSPQGVQSGWSPRNSRATLADPFRRSALRAKACTTGINIYPACRACSGLSGS